MFVGLAPRGGSAVARELGSVADMFVGLDPRGGPAVARELGSVADMFVGLDPRGGPAVARDLGSVADMFVGLDPAVTVDVVSAADTTGPRWRTPRGGARPRQRGGHVRRPRSRGGCRSTSAARRTCSSASIPRWAAVPLDVVSVADMFVGLDPFVPA